MRKPGTPEPETGAEKPGQGDEAMLRARLDALKSELGETIAEKTEAERKAAAPSESGSALAVGMRAASELVAGVLVGTGLGYLLDQQLGTKPLFLIVLMMFGVAAGFVNIARLGMRPTVQQAGKGEAGGPKTGPERR